MTRPGLSYNPNSAIGFFINFGANSEMEVGRAQYRLVQAIPLIPVGFALLCSLFLSDTPRWLASKDRDDEALASLTRLRGSDLDDPSVALEYRGIQEQVRMREQNLEDASTWTIIKEIATCPSYRKRFLLGVLMQTVAQWSGGNGITYYIPQVHYPMQIKPTHRVY